MKGVVVQLAFAFVGIFILKEAFAFWPFNKAIRGRGRNSTWRRPRPQPWPWMPGETIVVIQPAATATCFFYNL